MPERRTTVVVDFQAGDIDIGDEDIEIPVEVEAGGDEAEETTEEMSEWQEMLEDIFGATAGARISGFFERIAAGARRAATALGPLGTIILAAVITRLTVMYYRMKLAVAIFKQLGKIGAWALQQLWAGAQKATEALLSFVEQGVSASIRALELFVRATIDAANALRDKLMTFLERAVDAYADFQQSIANTVTVMGEFGKAADPARKKVAALAKEATKTSRIMATELADALYEVASSGRNTYKELAYFSDAIVMLAEATGTDAVESAETLTSILNQYNLRGKEARRATEMLVASIVKSPARMAKLQKSFEYVGSTAAMMNVGLEETTSLLMAFYKQGRTGSKAGVELQNIFNTLAKRTDKAREVLAQYGIQLDELSIAQRGLMPVLEKFEELGKRLQAAYGEKKGLAMLGEILQQAFTMRAGRGFAGVLMEGLDSIDKMHEGITGTNLAAKIQADQLRTLSGFWDKLVSLWENVYYDVLEGGLSPALQWVLKLLRDLVAQAREAGIFEKFGKMLYRLIRPIYSLIAAIGPKLIPAIDRMLDALPAAINRIGKTIRSVMPTIINAIVQLPKVFAEAVGTILPMVLRFVTTVAPLLLDFAEAVIPLLIRIVTKLGKALTQFVERNGQQIIRWFELLLNTATRLTGFLPTILPLMGRIVDMFMRWAPWLARVAINLIPQLLNIVRQLLPVFKTLANAVLPLIVWGLQQIVSIIEDEGMAALRQLTILVLKMVKTAVKAMPVLVSIVKKAFKVIAALLGAAAQNWRGFGSVILYVLKWIDKNFYYIILRILDLLKDFARQLKTLLALFAVLARVAKRVFGPIIAGLEVLLGIFAGLQAISATIATMWYGTLEIVAKIWSLFGETPEGLKKMRDWAKEMQATAWEEVRDTGQTMLDIAMAPEKIAEGFDLAAIAARNMENTLSDTYKRVRDVQRAQQRGGPRTTPTSGAAGRRGVGPGAAAGGAAGGQGGANNYLYQLGPWYFNDWETMKRTANQTFEDMQEKSEQSKRLRASGYGTAGAPSGR